MLVDHDTEPLDQRASREADAFLELSSLYAIYRDVVKEVSHNWYRRRPLSYRSLRQELQQALPYSSYLASGVADEGEDLALLARAAASLQAVMISYTTILSARARQQDEQKTYSLRDTVIDTWRHHRARRRFISHLRAYVRDMEHREDNPATRRFTEEWKARRAIERAHRDIGLEPHGYRLKRDSETGDYRLLFIDPETTVYRQHSIPKRLWERLDAEQTKPHVWDVVIDENDPVH